MAKSHCPHVGYRMSDAVGLDDPSTNTFILAIEEILDEIEIPTSLGEIGVPIDCAERIATKAMQDSAATTNPRLASQEDLRKLIEQAIIEAR